MNSLLKTVLLTAAAVCGLASCATAQNPHKLAHEFQRIRQQFSGTPMPTKTITPPRYHNQVLPNPVMYPHPPIHTTQPIPHPQYQQYPVYVSPDQFNGVNPFTGGIDTKNEQVDNSYYDRHRDASKSNGTRRWVRRPIYDVRGNIKGYQEGYVWTNSVTGVEHGELKNVTKNDKGGVHEQIQVRSVQRAGK